MAASRAARTAARRTAIPIATRIAWDCQGPGALPLGGRQLLQRAICSPRDGAGRGGAIHIPGPAPAFRIRTPPRPAAAAWCVHLAVTRPRYGSQPPAGAARKNVHFKKKKKKLHFFDIISTGFSIFPKLEIISNRHEFFLKIINVFQFFQKIFLLVHYEELGRRALGVGVAHPCQPARGVARRGGVCNRAWLGAARRGARSPIANGRYCFSERILARNGKGGGWG